MDETTLKHAELIQAIIARQSTDSFIVKGWSVTVIAAIYGAAIHAQDGRIAEVGIAITLAFAYLDAFHLRQERLFRGLYEILIAGGLSTPLLMNTDSITKPNTTWPHIFTSRPFFVFYIFQIVGGLALAIGIS